jgi:hypothetical protein
MAFGLDVFKEWYLSAKQRVLLSSQLLQPASSRSDLLSCVLLIRSRPWARYPHPVGGLFISALAGCRPRKLAIKAFAHLDKGRFSSCACTSWVGPHPSLPIGIKGDV